MHVFRRSNTRQKVERLIREGVGIREASWDVEQGEHPHPHLVEAIAHWIRTSMGEMRRPYGIDQIAVALACRDDQGRVVCSNSLGVVKPALFYGEGGAERIAAFLDDVSAVPGDSRREIVGAVLSLGDIAYHMELPRAA
jgi:hypothetical protein